MASRQPHVLLVVRLQEEARRIQTLLAESPNTKFTVSWERTPRQATEALTRTTPDIVLVDLDFPGEENRNLFSLIGSQHPNVPIVVISPVEDEFLALEIARYGAQDYLVRGQYGGALLVRTLRYAIERKRSSQIMRREQQLLESLLENSPDRIYFKDEKSRFIRVNPALATAHGLAKASEILGKTDFDIFRREHAEEAFADERRILETGEPLIGKVEREDHRDGHVTWSTTTKLPLRDRTGRIIGTMGISRDITKLREVEEDLKKERTLLRTILDLIPDNVFVKDREGRYLLTNPAHTDHLGAASSDEVLGRTIYDFFAREYADFFFQSDQAVLASGKPLLNVEEERYDEEGNQIWLLTSKVPVRDPDKQLIGLLGISRDVTQIKQAEANLRQALRELSETQIQLIEAEKSKSIGRLAAGIAHEVKNPLGIVRMGIELFQKSPGMPEKDRNEMLADMKDAVDRASKVIFELLDFSSPHPINHRPTDLNDLVERAFLFIRHNALRAKVQLKRELEDNLPAIMGDRNKLDQAVLNLLMNALTAMPDGGELVARTRSFQFTRVGHNLSSALNERFLPGDPVVMLEILDSGRGIPPEFVSKIFDPFFSTNPTGKGTGLGLMVTKNIIEIHGGVLTIENREEGGVRARILFPPQKDEPARGAHGEPQPDPRH